jgi:hypothetical protein
VPPLRRRCDDRALALHPGPLSVRRELDAEALEGFAFGEGDVGAMEVEDVGVERGVAVGHGGEGALEVFAGLCRNFLFEVI